MSPEIAKEVLAQPIVDARPGPRCMAPVGTPRIWELAQDQASPVAYCIFPPESFAKKLALQSNPFQTSANSNSRTFRGFHSQNTEILL